MKKDCVFYKQGQCRFKQKKASAIACLLCSTYYKQDNDVKIQDWFGIANSNKNFKIQIMISIFWLSIALFTLYEKHQISNQQNILKKQLKDEKKEIILLHKKISKLINNKNLTKPSTE